MTHAFDIKRGGGHLFFRRKTILVLKKWPYMGEHKESYVSAHVL